VTTNETENVTDDDTSEVVDIDEPTDSGAAADEEGDATKADSPSDESDVETKADAPSDNRIHKQLLRGARRNFVAIVIAVALIASAGVAAGLYFGQYRQDRETNAAAANVALDSAKNGTVALLSYSPETLDKDFANAKSNLTGDFLSYYTQFTEQIVTPAAKEKQVKTSASVVRAAVTEIHPDSAIVLLFINQVTTSKENPDGAFAASSVKVSLKKVDGRWLISAFDPV
jgi:Mce-associated membrane protein